MAEAFAASHGVEVADIIMEHLPPEGWGDLATKTDVVRQGLLLRSDLEERMSMLRTELRGEMSALRDGLKSDMSVLRDALRGEMSVLREGLKSDVSKLSNDLKAELATGFAQQLKWLVGTMVAFFSVMSGLVSVLVVVAK